MSLVEGTREPYSVIRARLRNPPNAVPDKGIDLRRREEPAPAVVIEPPRFKIITPVISDDEYVARFMATVPPPVISAPLSIRSIQRAVCMHFEMSRVELLARRRTMRIVRIRHIAMWLAKFLTANSYPEIGRRFGGMDHSSCIHGIRKIEVGLPNDQALRADVLALVTKIAPERSHDIPG